MKTSKVFRCRAALLLLSCSTLASAQARPVPPVADGYWNLVSNLSCPREATIRFYNGQHQLLHEEQVVGKHYVMKRHLVRRRTMSKLNASLEQVLRASQLTAGTSKLASGNQLLTFRPRP